MIFRSEIWDLGDWALAIYVSECSPLTCSGSSPISSNFSCEMPCAMIIFASESIDAQNASTHVKILYTCSQTLLESSNDEVSGALN